MDSLLAHLEQMHTKLDIAPVPAVDDPEADSNLVAEHANSGGDSIRQMANDIESLCHNVTSNDARDMLNLIQTRMARCLKLVPTVR